MDGSHNVKQKKPHTKVCIVWFYLHEVQKQVKQIHGAYSLRLEDNFWMRWVQESFWSAGLVMCFDLIAGYTVAFVKSHHAVCLQYVHFYIDKLQFKVE